MLGEAREEKKVGFIPPPLGSLVLLRRTVGRTRICIIVHGPRARLDPPPHIFCPPRSVANFRTRTKKTAVYNLNQTRPLIGRRRSRPSSRRLSDCLYARFFHGRENIQRHFRHGGSSLGSATERDNIAALRLRVGVKQNKKRASPRDRGDDIRPDDVSDVLLVPLTEWIYTIRQLYGFRC